MLRATQVAQVWIALQDLRHVYGAVSTDQARHRLHRFYWRCARPPASRS